MSTIKDIRTYALSLPETTEASHFGLVAFKVDGKVFIVLEKSGDSAIFSTDQEAVEAYSETSASSFEVVWRRHGQNRIFVGLRTKLDKVKPKQIRELVENAWQNKAPKRLVKGLDKSN